MARPHTERERAETMKKIAVFQHVDWEGPGRYLLEAAAAHSVELVVFKMWQRQFAELDDFDGLIILGGGPNVDEEEKYPFLVYEKIMIRAWLEKERPCLGICLGHQLLGQALGATIGPNFCPSVGFATGHLTHDGRRHPLLRGVPDSLPLFKWHGRALLPPVPGPFQILLTSDQCQVEAFSLRERPYIVGLQFDNHAAHPADVAVWLERDRPWLSGLTEIDVQPTDLLARAQSYQTRTKAHFMTIMANFFAMVLDQ